MATSKTVLSISILISGRKEMRKCLDSLKPFMEQLSCELILVDTGCSEEYQKIAREYTDKIIPFTWCNDFAKARNAGLNQAHGEWFMYLDDDEWFDNPEEIVEFFKSGEYRKYCSAYYLVRNYVDFSGTNYSDDYVMRMVKREKDTQFKGKIHEELQPFYLPEKIFKTHVEHYGYAFTSPKDIKIHAQRNIPPLIEQIELEPDKLRWYGQLAQEYLSIGEYEKGKETAEKGICRYEQNSNRRKEFYHIYAALYCYMVVHLIRACNFSKAKEIVEKALNIFKERKPYRAYLLQCAVSIYWELKNYEKCVVVAQEYTALYDELERDSELNARESFLIVSTAFQEELRAPAVIKACSAAAIKNNLAAMEGFFNRLDWQDSRMLGMQELETNLLKAMIANEYQPVFKTMIKTMAERSKGMVDLLPVFLELKKEYTASGNEEENKKLLHLISDISLEHWYVIISKIQYEDLVGKPDNIPQLVTALFKNGEQLFQIDYVVWNIVEKNQLNMDENVRSLDFNKWRTMVDDWRIVAGLLEEQEWKERISRWKESDDIRYDYFFIRCNEIELRQSNLHIYSLSELEKKLGEYAHSVLKFYSRYFKEEVFFNCPEILPLEAQLSLRLNRVIKTRSLGNDRDTIGQMRTLSGVYTPLEGVIATYVSMFRDEIHNRNDEMAQLAAGLKRNVRILIDAGKLDDAKAVITQLEQFIPGDEELQAFKDELQMN